MLTYKQKLLNEITQMPEDQLNKFYLIFQMIMKELKIEKDTVNNWKEDFENISVWKTDNFNETQEGFNQWKIKEFC
ncbi:MAG: hypothetical protein DRJ01_15240 [Bacteroidetes bacterium]|nr:MAG: hypothetical protein DRJ01_15240 [Bacteroidota bacterium]